MAGARKKPAKKKMVRGPKHATMRQAPAGTREEYRRRSKALAKRHGWTQTERENWEMRERMNDARKRHLSEHAKATKRGKAHGKAAVAAGQDYVRKRKAGESYGESYAAHKHHRIEEDRELRRGAEHRAQWRGTKTWSDHPADAAATGREITPTERIRRRALARQQEEGDAKRAAAKKKAATAKKKVTTAKKAAKKAAPKRSPAKKRAAPLKRRSYR
jgi:hypothetical protein